MERLKAALAGVIAVAGILAAIVVGSSDSWPAGVAYAGERHAEIMPGQVVVTFDGGTLESSQFAAIDSVAGASIVRRSARAGITTISVPVGSEEDFAETLADQPGVAIAEPNLLWKPHWIPNDTHYDLQWHLPMIQYEQAMDLTKGRNAVVAVLDTGVAFEDFNVFERAPDLDDTAFTDPYDATTGDAHPNDDEGHGTHVAGTIAQTSHNGYGVAGVAPRATVMPVKVCVIIGCPGDIIIAGIYWAVDHGADVLNMSLGGDDVMETERQAIAYAEEHGVTVIASAGNGGEDGIGDPQIGYPAALSTVIAVGAIDLHSELAFYSNYGSGEGKILDIVAPGGDIEVDDNGDEYADGVLQQTFAFTCSDAPFSYKRFDFCFYMGTSMAAPHVSGVAALIVALFPDLTPAQMRDLIRCGALDLGAPGHDAEFGAGLVQAYNVLIDVDVDGIPDCIDVVEAPSADINIGSATLDPGASYPLSLTAAITGPGLAAFTVDVYFDPQVATATACIAHPAAACNPKFAPGNVRVSGTSVEGLTGGFTLADITFEAIGGVSDSTALDIQIGELVNTALTDLAPTATVGDGFLQIQDPEAQVLGDTDCDSDVDTVDGLFVLRDTAGLPTGTCIDSGDVDCDDDVDTVDGLMIMRHVASLPVNVPAGCSPIGQARA